MDMEKSAVTMFCPNCGYAASSSLEVFNAEYLCPRCQQSGYFRHSPPAEPIHQTHPHRAEPVLEMPASSAAAPHHGLTLALGGLCIFLIGGIVTAIASGSGIFQTKPAEVVQPGHEQELETQYKGKLLKALAIKDITERNDALAELQQILSGSGLAVAQQVEQQLVKGLLEERKIRELDITAREEKAAFLAKEASAAEERIKRLAEKIELREQDLVTKESKVREILDREAALEQRALAQAQREERLSEFEDRLSSLEQQLTSQSLVLAEKQKALALQQDEVNQKLAQLESKADQDEQRVIIVEKPVPSVSSSFIIRETQPVYINGWSWGWPSHRTHYRWPQRNTWPDRHSSGFSFGAGGFSINIRK